MRTAINDTGVRMSDIAVIHANYRFRAPSDAIVFHAVFWIDRLRGLWQPLRYTPAWGLIVVRFHLWQPQDFS